MSSTGAQPHNIYEECTAHVIWAAHILSYLTGEQNHTKVLPEPDLDEDNEKHEDSNDDDFDAKTDREAELILTESSDSVRFKLLDCVAELVSPRKGWDHVVATGLRESNDGFEIDVARNDGFCMDRDPENGEFRTTAADTKTYLGQLENFLTDSSAAGSFSSSSTSLDGAAIEFNRQRIDKASALLARDIVSLPSLEDHEVDSSAAHQQAVQIWTNLAKLVNRRGAGESSPRAPIAHAAYRCLNSSQVHDALQTAYKTGFPKIWRKVGQIARPVSNCRLLVRIVSRLPHSRRFKICPCPPRPKTRLNLKYRVDITDAWSRLRLSPLPDSERKQFDASKRSFRKDCARALSSHAEVQLYLHYESSSTLAPSVDYFGCSKKSCFLCESFLQDLPQPISTRGRHGICYPAWAVPATNSRDVVVALQQLKKTLVSRIEMHILHQRGDVHMAAVPQSTFISDFSKTSLEEALKRKEIAKSVEKKSQTIREERGILEGQVSKPGAVDPPGTVPQSQTSCVMCNTSPAWLCGGCNSCSYCSTSSKCKESDSASHKILCEQFPISPPRPSLAHKLALCFPETEIKPLLTWVSCYPDADTECEHADVSPFLGEDDPLPGRVYIEYNPRRDKRLGSGIGRDSPKKEGYAIELTYRDTFLKDGSIINRSIMESVKRSGTVGHKWCGPIVAMRKRPLERYGDITLADFRHIIDYFVTYNTSEVRELPNPQTHIRTPRTVLGVKICCYGEIKLHGSEPFIPVEVPPVHPIRRDYQIDRSPISKLLRRPLRLWKFPDIQRPIDPPGWNHDMHADSNGDAAFLMIDADPKSENWGWAPLYWNTDIGNVLAIYDDQSDLTVDEMRLMCYFTHQKLRPLFEDSLGGGIVSRTKQEVLDFITRENMEKCRDKAQSYNGAFD